MALVSDIVIIGVFSCDKSRESLSSLTFPLWFRRTPDKNAKLAGISVGNRKKPNAYGMCFSVFFVREGRSTRWNKLFRFGSNDDCGVS